MSIIAICLFQVFHICDGGRKISFLCPNGTIFRQSHLICDWWFRVDCDKSKEQYQESAELLAHDQMIYKKRAEEIAKAMQHGESKDHAQTIQFVETTPVSNTVRPKSQNRRKPHSRTSTKVTTNDYDRERQYLSETSSFVGSQRHRFGGSSGENVGRNPFDGDTDKPATTINPTFYTAQEPTTAKPVFTIRVKPNREFSFVELKKQDSKKSPKENRSPSVQPNPYPDVRFVSSRPVQVTAAYSYTHTPSPRMQYSSSRTSKLNSISTNTKIPSYSSGYSKNNYDYSLATTELPPYFPNKTNDIEYIRPEMINSLMETEPTVLYPKFGTPTPASAVNTLHSLASYYESAANDVRKELVSKDTDYTKPAVSEILLRALSGGSGESGEQLEEMMITVTTPKPQPTNNYSDTVLPSVLTKATQLSYSYLFKNEKPPGGNLVKPVTKNVEATTSRTRPEVVKVPERIVIDNTISDKDESKSDDSREIQQQKESADLRELAQVFTRALSAYLEDPESFKEILAQVRPTEPNHDATTPSPEDEVLAFSDDNKNSKPQALPVTRTTVRPFTPNDINNFIAAVTNVDADNSLEVSPASGLLSLDSVRYLTTTAKTSIARDINGIAVNGSLNNLASGEYYSSASGSVEDNSYFPTAGGVTDRTRPRYGGFQNNTGDVYINDRKYSRYGAELPPNITGAPLSERPLDRPVATTPISVSTLQSTMEHLYQKIPEKLNLPDAYDVNNLAASSFFGEPSGQFNSQETYLNHKKEDPLLTDNDYYNHNSDQEKLLVASGSQSLFSANNYYKYKGKENDVQKKADDAYTSLYSPFSYTNGVPSEPPASDRQADRNKYIAADPTFVPTTVPNDYLERTTYSPDIYRSKQDDESLGDTVETYTTIDPFSEQVTTDINNIDLFENKEINPSSRYTIQNVDLGNGVTLERTLKYGKPAVTWAPPTQTESFIDDWSEESDVLPTTYHPRHKIGASVTTPNPFFIPPEPQLEQKAKEMFGGLNESATGKLMDMVDMAQSNTTIRKLVLLLVSDNSKENLTVEESRANLIRALLVDNDLDSSAENRQTSDGLDDGRERFGSVKCDRQQMARMEMSAAHSDRYNGIPCSQGSRSGPTTTPLPPETSSRMEFSVSSSVAKSPDGVGEKISSKYRSGKNYRGIESQTAVVGSSLQSTELNNRLNTAKLFIPSNPDRKIPYDSDARAVELLKSLYNLAAKFG